MLEKHGILQGSLEKQFQVAYSLAYTSDILPFVHQSSIEQSSLQNGLNNGLCLYYNIGENC